MKKQRIAVVALLAGAMFAASAPSWAFTPQGTSTVTAGAFVQGSRVARFNLAFRDVNLPLVSNPAISSITWSGIDPNVTNWKIADTLLVMNSTVTDSGGGVQIFTDNTAADAKPKFIDPTPTISSNTDSACAGLLYATSTTGGFTSKVALPVAWSIKATTKTVENTDPTNGIGNTDPNTGSTTGYNNKFQWLFVTDRYNTLGIDFDNDGVIDPSDGDAAPFVDGAPFITLRNLSGLHNTQDPADFSGGANGQDAYIYFEAKWSGAEAQRAYQTTTLRLQAFLQ
jgi:hypothetical protein